MAGRLTAEQVGTIRRWAERNPYIDSVRVFVNRRQDALGKMDDIDLLVTIVGGRRNTPDGLYTRFADLWAKELGRLLGISVGLQGYPPAQSEMKAKMDRTAIILWTREEHSEPGKIRRKIQE